MLFSTYVENTLKYRRIIFTKIDKKFQGDKVSQGKIKENFLSRVTDSFWCLNSFFSRL